MYFLLSLFFQLQVFIAFYYIALSFYCIYWNYSLYPQEFHLPSPGSERFTHHFILYFSLLSCGAFINWDREDRKIIVFYLAPVLFSFLVSVSFLLIGLVSAYGVIVYTRFYATWSFTFIHTFIHVTYNLLILTYGVGWLVGFAFDFDLRRSAKEVSLLCLGTKNALIIKQLSSFFHSMWKKCLWLVIRHRSYGSLRRLTTFGLGMEDMF